MYARGWVPAVAVVLLLSGTAAAADESPPAGRSDGFRHGGAGITAAARSRILRVRVLAVDVGLRWFARPPSSRVRPYVELLAGPLYGFRHIPEPGSAFNFLLQLAGGAVLPVGSRARLVAAYRWVHISNAGTSHDNPSWNYSTLELGTRWEYP